METSFPLVFWRHKMLVVCSIPHNVDKVRARRSIQNMFDRDKSFKFKIKKK